MGFTTTQTQEQASVSIYTLGIIRPALAKTRVCIRRTVCNRISVKTNCTYEIINRTAPGITLKPVHESYAAFSLFIATSSLSLAEKVTGAFKIPPHESSVPCMLRCKLWSCGFSHAAQPTSLSFNCRRTFQWRPPPSAS